ncbi:hypothetical protein ACFFRR_001636 [Megaselia abdita]
MNEKSTTKDFSKLLTKSKVFQSSVKRRNDCRKESELLQEETTNPPVFDDHSINGYVRDLVSKYLEKEKPLEKKIPSVKKVSSVIESTVPVQIERKPSSEKIQESSWMPVEKNEMAQKPRPPSSMTSIRLPFSRFTGQPTPDPVSFTEKHPTLVLDPSGNSDDDGRYLFHRRKNVDPNPLKSKKKIASSSDDEKLSTSSSSSSSVVLVEKPVFEVPQNEQTWHHTLKNLSRRPKKSPMKSPPRKESRKVILNSPKVQILDNSEKISRLKTKSFPVLSIKDKCYSVHKVVSISIEPQECQPLNKTNNVHYFECAHDDDSVINVQKTEISVNGSVSVDCQKGGNKEIVQEKEEEVVPPISASGKFRRKDEKDQINRFLMPFIKDLNLEDEFVTEIPSPTTTSSSTSASTNGKHTTPYNPIDSLLSVSVSTSDSAGTLENKSTSLRVSNDLTSRNSSSREQFSARAKELLNELDEICTNGRRANSSISSFSASEEKTKKPFEIPRLPRLSFICSTTEEENEEDNDDTSTEISSCFSLKSSESSINMKNGEWDSLSDGEVLSLGEI